MASDREAKRQRYRKWQAANLDKHREKMRRYRAADPVPSREVARRQRLKRFGLSEAEFETMVESQEGVCAICKGPCRTGNRLAVDHDHDTGAVRGLLCLQCNTQLGWYERHMAAVAAYLRNGSS